MNAKYLGWLVVGSIIAIGLLILYIVVPTAAHGEETETPPPLTQEPIVTGLPIETEPPTEPPTEAPTEPPTGLFAIVSNPTVCYSGPGRDYQQLVINVPVGVQVEVVGTNSQGKNWFLVQGSFSGVKCWIEIAYLEPAFEITLARRIPSALIVQNSNCRVGDDPNHNNLAFVYTGQEVLVDKKNVDADWFVVTPPTLQGQCWITISSLNYDPNIVVGLEIAESPPLPVIVIPPTEDHGAGGGGDIGGGVGGGGGGSGGGGGGPTEPPTEPTPCWPPGHCRP